jgi:4-hydroxy-tetrahydrodipicolinate reductase
MPDQDARIPVTVAGAAGRMGRALTGLLVDHPRLRLGACLMRPGHSWLDAAPAELAGARITTDPATALAVSRAVIDFTLPEAAEPIARAAAAAGAVHVLGSTGFSDADLARLEEAGRGAVTIRSGNMSLGVNLLAVLTRQVAAALDESFDIEIGEVHHRNKIDAPSGTAMLLGEAAAAGRGVRLAEVAQRGRDGHTGVRPRGAIGFASLRGGDVVGEHDVWFAGPGERLILRHVATDRTIYARGALKAAEWGLSQAPGQYSMLDVLGL